MSNDKWQRQATGAMLHVYTDIDCSGIGPRSVIWLLLDWPNGQSQLLSTQKLYYLSWPTHCPLQHWHSHPSHRTEQPIHHSSLVQNVGQIKLTTEKFICLRGLIMFDKVQAEFWRVLINIFIIRVLSLLRPGRGGCPHCTLDKFWGWSGKNSRRLLGFF